MKKIKDVLKSLKPHSQEVRCDGNKCTTLKVFGSKIYKRSEFSEEEIRIAKIYLKKAVIGLVTIKAEEYIDFQLERILSGPGIMAEDEIHFQFDLHTIGNDLLAAMGAARNELANKD